MSATASCPLAANNAKVDIWAVLQFLNEAGRLSNLKSIILSYQIWSRLFYNDQSFLGTQFGNCKILLLTALTKALLMLF